MNIVAKNLCPEDDDNDRISFGSVDLIERLNQIDYEFEQSQQIEVIVEVSSDYGNTKRDTFKVNLETCKNQNYEFSQTTYECFQSSYDGFIFAEDNYSIYLGDNLTIAHTGQPLPLNTQCSEYNGSFTQFIDVSSNLMTLNLSDIDPKEDSKIPLNTILKLQFYVRMKVVSQKLSLCNYLLNTSLQRS